MRSLLAGAGLLVFSALTASAADYGANPYSAPQAPYAPYAPYFTWTGFYLGVNGGYGWGNSRWDFPGGTTGEFKLGRGEGRGTAGYRDQIGPSGLGIEADADWTDIRGNPNANCGPTCFTSNTWLT